MLRLPWLPTRIATTAGLTAVLGRHALTKHSQSTADGMHTAQRNTHTFFQFATVIPATLQWPIPRVLPTSTS